MERPDLDAIEATIAYDSVGTTAGDHLQQVIDYARHLKAALVSLIPLAEAGAGIHDEYCYAENCDEPAVMEADIERARALCKKE